MLPHSYLLKLDPDFLLCKAFGMASKEGYSIVHGHRYLLLPNRHEAFRKRTVVLHKKPCRNHEIINVVENKGLLRGVQLLALDERHGVLAPVSKGVEVVRGMVAIVETVTITLV